MIFVLAVLIINIVCGISLSCGQPSATLMPQHQTVCRGENISHYCFGNGTSMLLHSPPTVNKTDAFSFFGRDDFLVSSNRLAAAVALVDPARNSSIMGTLIQYASNEGEYSVFCQVFMIDQSLNITSSANFFVIGAPNAADNFTYYDCRNCEAVSDEGTEKVPVPFSWVPSKSAQEYTLQLNKSAAGFVKTVRSLESSVILPLPYGDYFATLCAVNSCGRACSNHSVSIPRPTPQQDSTTGIIAGVVVGVAIISLAVGVGGVIVGIVCGVKAKKRSETDNICDKNIDLNM